MHEKIVGKPAERVSGERLFAYAREEAAQKPACTSAPEAIWDIDWDDGPDHSHSD